MTDRGGQARDGEQDQERLMNVATAKSGMRKKVMPGARSFIIVTMKFTAPAMDEMPSTQMATVQK